MKTSPTQRSLKDLRAKGYSAAVVEHWNQFAHIRQDLYGWIDIVACSSKYGILGVQTTTYSNMKARIAKAKGNIHLANWLGGGGALHVHGWRKVKGRWEVEVFVLQLKDVAPCVNKTV